MITHITNANAEKYSVLFEQAENQLKLGDPSVSITSLNEYFSYLEQIVNSNDININDKLKYTKLPLDEDYITINANSRRISVPYIFASNGIGVVGDHEAEIVYFVIDRYFDSMDLGSNDINIYIQWEAPNGKSGFSINYGKFIENQELSETEVDQKVIFGWAINKYMTEASGRIRFAVHFVRKDSNQELLYAFNTQPAELTIHNTLVMKSDISADEQTANEQEIENLLKRISSKGIYDLAADLPGIPEFVQDLTAYEVYAPAGAIPDETAIYFNNTTTNFISISDYDNLTYAEQANWTLVERVDNIENQTHDYIFHDGKYVNIPEGGFAVLKASAKTSLGTLYYTLIHNDAAINDSRYVYTIVDYTEVDPAYYNNNQLTINSASPKYYYLDDNNEFKLFPYLGTFTVSNGKVSFNPDGEGLKNYTLYTRSLNPTPTEGDIKVIYESANGKAYNPSQVYYKQVGDGKYERIEPANIPKNSETNIITDSNDVHVLEQFMIYTLKDELTGRFTGDYSVKVESVKGLNAQEKRMIAANYVKVLDPVTPELIDDGTTNATHQDEEEIYHVVLDNNNQATLKVTDKSNEEDEFSHDTNYAWQQYNEKSSTDDRYENIYNANARIYEIEVTAQDEDYNAVNRYYRCTATAYKHHKLSEQAKSAVYRVTLPAVAPILTPDDQHAIVENIIKVNIPRLGSPNPDFIPLTFGIENVQSDELKYALIKENLVTGEDEAELHIIKLIQEDLDKLGLPGADENIQVIDAISNNPFVPHPTTDQIISDDLIEVENNSITITRNMFRDSGFYRLIVINQLNNNIKYTLSDPIQLIEE